MTTFYRCPICGAVSYKMETHVHYYIREGGQYPIAYVVSFEVSVVG